MVRLVDTHAHLYAQAFDEDRDKVLKRAQDLGVNKILLPNIDEESLEPMMQLCKAYPSVCFPMIGLHPCDVKEDYESVLARMESVLKNPHHPFVAVGETGMDLYWDRSTQDMQHQALLIQINWAQKYNLPIVIHARESIPELLDVFEHPECPSITGVFHCFTGSYEQAKRIIDLGFYLGIGGVVTFKKSGLAEVVKRLPVNRLVLETDAPYLAPVPYRGKRNESSYVTEVAQYLAQVLGVSVENIAKQTTHNARVLFSSPGIWK